MGSYLPTTPKERQEMLKAIGLSELKDLYTADVPSVLLKDSSISRRGALRWRSVRKWRLWHRTPFFHGAPGQTAMTIISPPL